MFPLGTVLLPYSLLPLHLFEQRYRKMMADILGEGPSGGPGGDREPEMGVVLIERGHEVGGGDERTGLGTVARIVRAEQFPDGRWFLLAAGTRRFKVLDWLPDDPYPLAELEELEDEDWDTSCGEILGTAEREVRRALALAGELGEPVSQPELSPDPMVASWQLCAAVPVGPLDRQTLLAAPGIAERLAMVASLASEAAALLAYRLGGT